MEETGPVTSLTTENRSHGVQEERLSFAGLRFGYIEYLNIHKDLLIGDLGVPFRWFCVLFFQQCP